MAAATSRGSARQRGKTIEEVVSYAISHRTRIEILIVLAQGTYSPSEVAEIIRLPLNSVANHMRELAEGGAIEIVDNRICRNAIQHFYRAVTFPEYSRKDLVAMHPLERQVTVGLIIQSLLAEILAAMWNEKISEDPNHCLIWDQLCVDEQGRREITEEQERHWRRLQEIKQESLVRAGLSGEETVPYIISILGFERGRKAPVARGSDRD